MIQIKLTDSGDIDMSSGNIQWIDGNDAVRQHLISRFNVGTGTFKIYPKSGIPFHEKILGHKDTKLASEIIKTYILETPDILSVSDYSYEFNNVTRTLSVSFICVTTFSEINIEDLAINI